MIQVLFIARYRDATMHRKVELLAQQPDLQIVQVVPSIWHDELMHVEQTGETRRIALRMVGLPSDPHRAIYRTLSFSLPRLRPHIIHAEEEPDSLAALQIAAAQRLFAPTAKLILNTWQNIDRPRASRVRWVTGATLSASDGVLCANSEALALLRAHGYVKCADVIPPIGVDTRPYQPRRNSPAEVTDIFTIGYVGRLVPEKGVDLLIDAVSLIDAPTRLRIIGDGPSRDALQQRVQAKCLSERVQFSGALSPSQVAAEMRELDALVLPSRTTHMWKEQFGRVLVEAMACKVPVVGSNSGAIPEVIGDAGLVFQEGDIGALSTALRRLIDSPALRRDLAERGYERVRQHFTQERIAERTAAFYRCLIASSP